MTRIGAWLAPLLMLCAVTLGSTEKPREMIRDPDRVLLQGQQSELREVCLSLEDRPEDTDHPAALALLARLAPSPEEADRRQESLLPDRLAQAELAYLQGRFREARRHLLALAADRALAPRDGILLARCALRLGDRELAVEVLRRTAVGIGPLAEIARAELDRLQGMIEP